MLFRSVVFGLLFTATFYFIGVSVAPTTQDFAWFRQGIVDTATSDRGVVLLVRDVAWFPEEPDDTPTDSLLMLSCNALALDCQPLQRVYSDYERTAQLRRDNTQVVLLLDGREAARVPLDPVTPQ